MNTTLSRRRFVTTTAMALADASVLGAAESKRPGRILLRSSWQTVNIGDIGHTPGVIALLEKHLPEAEIQLWPSKVDNGVEEMLRKRFPKLKIVQGAEALKTAFAECDFLLHGSGPSLVAEKDVAKWKKETGKPYGVYGITLSSSTSEKAVPTATSPSGSTTIDILSAAQFVFFRDSVSMKVAKDRGCTCSIMEFGPDGAFAVDLRNDAAAVAFLKSNHLEEGQFLCCIPRLRNTPYWTIPSKKAAFDEKKHARNEAMKEHDHAPLREAIIAVVRGTKLKVLLCPEDETQVAVSKEMLFDKLPDDVKPRVVWRDRYWITDEALSTYVRSAGLFGNEMHSPIMCIGNGVPAIVCRWAEQTSKGYMWRDIGLEDWLFNFDDEKDLPRVAPTVLAMAKDLPAARAKAAKAREFVLKRQRETMAIVKRSLEAASKA